MQQHRFIHIGTPAFRMWLNILKHPFCRGFTHPAYVLNLHTSSSTSTCTGCPSVIFQNLWWASHVQRKVCNLQFEYSFTWTHPVAYQWLVKTYNDLLWSISNSWSKEWMQRKKRTSSELQDMLRGHLWEMSCTCQPVAYQQNFRRKNIGTTVKAEVVGGGPSQK